MAKKKRIASEVRPTLAEIRMPGADSKKKPKAEKKERPTKQGPKLMMTKASPQTLIPVDRRESLAAWFSLYLGIEVGRPSAEEPASHTFKAKRSDLERFLEYVTRTAGDDHPDGWTKSLSTGFLRDLKKQTSPRTGKPYAATTVDRVLATLRHAAKWIGQQRPFLAGNPMVGIKDTAAKTRPAWKGLDEEKNEVTRMKSAAEQLKAINTRNNQRPYRNYALLLVGLNSALRPSELLALDLSQYDGTAFSNVTTKGNQTADRIPLGKEAREALDDYIEAERGEDEGPLFQSKSGKRLSIQKYDEALKSIAAQANSRLSSDNHIHVSPHLLRHTALRKLCRSHGIEFAKKRANHISDRHIWRYVEPGEQEFEDAVEEL